ncbi:hypothetical protein PX52LOC_04363 [Limnoglobus roseus]|uniref:Uncharacterized protein n=1 Tax=Limnoglobus roseus TaxID=2598579 RepID=A0A5C1AKI3_9BACT|nr:hypothetical protein PX52LOC_04363 [Limnoglobus roseus]
MPSRRRRSWFVGGRRRKCDPRQTTTRGDGGGGPSLSRREWVERRLLAEAHSTLPEAFHCRCRNQTANGHFYHACKAGVERGNHGRRLFVVHDPVVAVQPPCEAFAAALSRPDHFFAQSLRAACRAWHTLYCPTVSTLNRSRSPIVASTPSQVVPQRWWRSSPQMSRTIFRSPTILPLVPHPRAKQFHTGPTIHLPLNALDCCDTMPPLSQAVARSGSAYPEHLSSVGDHILVSQSPRRRQIDRVRMP